MTDSERLGDDIHHGKVLAEWIDINQHMNVAYYVLAFDLAIDSLWENFGITEDHINTSDSSTFAVESHVTWQRELSEGDDYIITTQILAYSDKGIHQFMRMFHAEERFLAATSEWLNFHVDLSERRVAPWPDPIMALIKSYVDRQPDWKWPPLAGKQMALRQPIFQANGAK